MELTNEFQVPVPVDQAWAALTDVERIAPCLPGAQLDEVDGDDYHGTVKVKVGPITATYKGTARFLEKDDTDHKAVLKAEGRETRGQGNANATITAVLTPAGDAGSGDGSTTVSVVTDLQVAGRVAQFGRGVLADVSAKLLSQFAGCLESKLQNGESDETGGAAAEGASGTGSSGAYATAATSGTGAGPSAGASGDTSEAVDLLDTAGAPVAKRLLPAAAAALGGLFVLRRLRRRRRRRRA